MGLAQPCRYLLASTGEDWKDHTYTMETGPVWFGTDKPAMRKNINFPNLPYFKDGDLTITQSGAILRYLGEKYNFQPKTIQERARAEMLFGAMKDIWDKFYKFVASGQNPVEKYNDPEVRTKFHDELKAALKNFEDELAGQKFILGDEVCWVDFQFFHLITILRAFSNDVKNMEWTEKYVNGLIEKLGDKFKTYFEQVCAEVYIIIANYWHWGGATFNEVKPCFE